MNILPALALRKTQPRPARPMPAPAAAASNRDERPLGCGWFDSSHDLERGLVVREHLGPEALARELPLDFWLDLELRRRPS